MGDHLIRPRHLLIEDLDPNEVFVNKDLYDNNDIEVRYAQALDPWRWTRGWTHAMGMATFLAGIIFIFVLLYIQDLRIDRARLRVAIANTAKSPSAEQETVQIHRSFLDRMSTHLRSFTYKRTPSRWWWSGMGNMSLGLALIIMAGFAYPLLYVFTQKPYYMRYARYGPPGLASRAGMTAISTTPFIIALSMKANLISVITGVGHERLNALHRWLAGLAGLMAVVHTVPFLVEPYREGGWSAVGEKLTRGRGNIYYWNGLAALCCLAWLNLASLPFLRRWCYEFFVQLHILAGVGYLAMLFWHCNNMLSSWHYLWATAFIWASGLAWRLVFKTNWFSTSGRWFSGDTAVLSRLTDDGVKITIATRTKWKPGQHIFLRIPAIGIFDNHPFTIASVMRDDGPPSPTSDTTHDTTAQLKHENDGRLDRVRRRNKYGDSGAAAADEYNDMVLVFKPYAGFTRKAFKISREVNDVSFRALLDGPYGGMPRKLESFDTVLMIAGGSGITPVVAHLQDLCRKIAKGQAVTQDVRIVWTVKRFESLEWFKDEISVACRSVPFGLVHCQYFVTEESPVEFCDYPVSATQQWPKSPAIPDWSTTKPAGAEAFSSWPSASGGRSAGGGGGGGDGEAGQVAAGLGLTIPDGRSSRGSNHRDYPLPGTAVTTPDRDDHHRDDHHRRMDFPTAYPQYPQYPRYPQDAHVYDHHRQSLPSPVSPVMPAEAPYNPHHTPPQLAITTTTPAETHPNPFSTPANDPSAVQVPAPTADPFTTPVSGPGEATSSALDLPAPPAPVAMTTATLPTPSHQHHPTTTTTTSDDHLRNSIIEIDFGTHVTGNNNPHRLSEPTGTSSGTAAHRKKPSLRVSLPAYKGEEVDGIVRCPSPHHPDGPNGKRTSYGPADFGDEVMIEFGRPRLREGIRPWAETFGRRTCIYVCGPERMKIDVSNAVASLQMDIWRKENVDREEVYLHTETFGW